MYILSLQAQFKGVVQEVYIRSDGLMVYRQLAKEIASPSQERRELSMLLTHPRAPRRAAEPPTKSLRISPGRETSYIRI